LKQNNNYSKKVGQIKNKTLNLNYKYTIIYLQIIFFYKWGKYN